MGIPISTPIVQQCAYCRWSVPLEGRYDQLRCTNEDSREAWGDVEATECCDLFEPTKRMTPEQNEKRNAEIHRVVSILPVKVLALGYIRYEKLRLLNASQYAELNRRNLAGEGHFDDLVDQLEEPK